MKRSRAVKLFLVSMQILTVIKSVLHACLQRNFFLTCSWFAGQTKCISWGEGSDRRRGLEACYRPGVRVYVCMQGRAVSETARRGGENDTEMCALVKYCLLFEGIFGQFQRNTASLLLFRSNCVTLHNFVLWTKPNCQTLNLAQNTRPFLSRHTVHEWRIVTHFHRIFETKLLQTKLFARQGPKVLNTCLQKATMKMAGCLLLRTSNWHCGAIREIQGSVDP